MSLASVCRGAAMTATLGFFMLAAPPASAEVFINEQVYFDAFPVFVPCAAGGAGETIVLSGYLHIVVALTFDRAGGFHAKSHFQPQGFSGFGLTTGDKYQGTGVTQDETNIKIGEEFTSVNNFRMIGQGTGNNLLVHQNVHLTVNANGTLTVFVDNTSFECK